MEDRKEYLTSEEYREENFGGKDIMNETKEEKNKREQKEKVWLENMLRGRK